MEGVKFEDMMDWIKGLQGMEDIAKTFSHSTRDDPNMRQLQIQWKLDHEVQQAFKRLKPALTNCIKVLGNVVDFKQKSEVTQTQLSLFQPIMFVARLQIIIHFILFGHKLSTTHISVLTDSVT